MAGGKTLTQVIAIAGKLDPTLQQSINKAEKMTIGMGAKIKSAAATAVGALGAISVVDKVKDAAQACWNAAVDIDTALTGVRKTVDGTEEQYQQLKQAAIDYSKTNAVSATQMLDLQALGAQLGYNIDELSMFSQVAAGLDIATDMDAETAATELAQFANITGMAHENAERYASTIVNLGNNMATTESKISSMGQRVAAASTQVGMSQADILGWSAAMSSLGIEAEAGGTAFSTTISTIDAAVAKGGDKLQKFAEIAGMSAEEFSASWKNSATDTFKALLEGTNGAENMTIALEEMGVTGIRQSDVLKRLAGNTELVSSALETANEGWRENTALQNEVDNRNASMAARLEILQNKLTAVAESIGTPMVNAVLDVLSQLEPYLDQFATAVLPALMDVLGQLGSAIMPVITDVLSALMPLIIEVVGIVGELLSALMPLIELLLQIVGALLSPLISLVSQLLQSILAPIIPVIAQVAGVIGNVVSALMPIIDPLMQIVGALLPPISGLVQGIMVVLQPVIGVISGIAGAISTLVGWLSQVISLAAQAASAIASIGGGIVGGIAGIFGFATGGFTNGLAIAGEDPRYPTEAVISFNPAYRAQNIKYWRMAGAMLGAQGGSTVPVVGYATGGFTGEVGASLGNADYAIGSGGYTDSTTYDLSGITFSPQVVVRGNVDADAVIQAIRDEEAEFIDMILDAISKREEAVYA